MTHGKTGDVARPIELASEGETTNVTAMGGDVEMGSWHARALTDEGWGEGW
jgi:hypothetical protein